MNIEESIKILDKFITEHKLFNIKHSDGLEEAIETLLTAYEKEKEKNIQTLEYIEREEINSIGTPFTYTQIGKNIKRKLEGE